MISLRTRHRCQRCANKEQLRTRSIIGGTLELRQCPGCFEMKYLNEYRLPVICGQVVRYVTIEQLEKKYKLKGTL